MFCRLVHNEPMTLQEWLKSLPGSPTVSQAADHSGVSKATLLRHDKKGETTAEYAISIARAYEVNEVQALIDLGFITEKAVRELGITMSLDMATNEALLEQVLRRSDPQARVLFGNDGDDDVIGLRPDFRVVSTPAAINDDEDDGTVKDFDWSQPHAADSSINESEARIERGEDPID